MKKLLLTIVCSLAVAEVAMATGSVNWASISIADMTAETNTTVFSPLFGGGLTGGGAIGFAGGSATLGTGFYWELLYSDTFTGSQLAGTLAPSNSLATLFNGTWFDSGLGGSNSLTAGRLAPINPNTAATVPWSPGQTDNIVMVGWSANLGSSWTTVSNSIVNWLTYDYVVPFPAFFGVSATGYLTPFADGVNPGAIVFANVPTTQGLPINSPDTQLYALPIPEPATFVLAGLGGLALMLFRRRH